MGSLYNFFRKMMYSIYANEYTNLNISFSNPRVCFFRKIVQFIPTTNKSDYEFPSCISV